MSIKEIADEDTNGSVNERGTRLEWERRSGQKEEAKEKMKSSSAIIRMVT